MQLENMTKEQLIIKIEAERERWNKAWQAAHAQDYQRVFDEFVLLMNIQEVELRNRDASPFPYSACKLSYMMAQVCIASIDYCTSDGERLPEAEKVIYKRLLEAIVRNSTAQFEEEDYDEEDYDE